MTDDTDVNSSKRASKGRNEMLKKEKSYFSRYRLPKPNASSKDSGGVGDGTPDRKSILVIKTQRESLSRSSNGDNNKKPGKMGALSSFFGKSSRRNFAAGLRTSVRNSLRSSKMRTSPPVQISQIVEDSTTARDSTTAGARPRVSFDKIHTRSYHIECDDNPACAGKGPAIHLSWKYDTPPSMSVEEYEGSRPDNGPRKIDDLKMNVVERERLLMEAGASRKEMKEFAKRVQKAKMKRLQTIEDLKVHGKANMDKAEKRMEQRESMGKGVLRLLHLRRTETQEQVELWRKARMEQNNRAAAGEEQGATTAVAAQ